MSNEEKYLKEQVVLAALVHHIGLFFHRVDPDKTVLEHTEKFCEELYSCLPSEKKNIAFGLITLEEKPPQLWKQLATESDDLSEEHKFLKELIHTAYEFAISEQKATENGRGDYLQSLLECVNLAKEESRESKHCLPLQALSLENTIYPVLIKENTKEDYKKLVKEFWKAFYKMPKFKEFSDNTFRHLTYNLLSLFERFFSQVPASETPNSPSDISLFDHLRIKAAIAEGLYEFHKDKFEHATLEDFKSESEVKWLLVCGDFSGIQKFIYNIALKNAAKALRGRSLYIQLLCDAISQHLTQKLGLFPTSRIYSSGGKFYLLIPTKYLNALKIEVTKVNQWLLRSFRGLVFLGIGSAGICAKDFHGGNMGERWKEANENLMKDRQQRFKAVMGKTKNSLKEFFSPMDLHFSAEINQQFCSVCGRDDKATWLKEKVDAEQGTSRVICRQCELMEQLGKALIHLNPDTINYFFWDWNRGQQFDCLKTLAKKQKRFRIFASDLYVIEEGDVKNLAEEDITANDSYFLEKVNDVHYSDFPDDFPKINMNVGFRFVGVWDTKKQSDLEKLIQEQPEKSSHSEKVDDKDKSGFDFEQFAKLSEGIPRVGILRMDVDNLGQVFVNGLNFKDNEMGSLSRVATLSRQLNLFFSGHLNQLLKKYQRTQIIYAGGDDLFLIGSWNELPEVACTIRNKFEDYCAGNPNFTLSGGMAMVAGKYPIYRAAALAGDQEEKAKHIKEYSVENCKKQKDAFSFLETPIPWAMYDEVRQFRELIESIIEESGNRAIIDRLREVVLSMKKFELLSKKEDKTMDDFQELIMYQKWRWRLIYNLARMKDRQENLQDKLENVKRIILDNCMDGKCLLLQPSQWLPLPVRWAEFLTRGGEK